MRTLYLAVLLALGISGVSWSQPRPAAGAPAKNKLALLIGINRYKYPNAVSPLAGSINDVEDEKALLIGKYEFPPENILVLKDEQATHAAIIAAIQNHLIAKAQAGDIVVFHYSGHGSESKDVTGKKISGLDETIVPYDSRDPQGKVFDITGSELHALLRQLSLKTKNITFILDSCHSGTLVRGPRVRSIPPDTRTPPPLPAYAAGERGLHDVAAEPVPPFALIAAATSKESAFEHLGAGKEHGALTWFLTQQLRLAKPGATYRDVMDSVIANVNANYPAQHPQLEGADSDQQIFGEAAALAQPYVPASPLDRLRVTLGEGQASGMTAGSTFDVYRPGTKRFGPPEKPLASVQVTSVGDFTSEAKIVSGGPVPVASRAVERVHRYGSARMRLYLHEAEKSPTIQALATALKPLSYIEITSDPTRCHLQVEEIRGRVAILGADRTTTSNPVSVTAADAVDHLVSQLQKWAKWFNVLSIRSVIPGPDVQVGIKAAKDGTSRDLFQKLGKADAAVKAGDRVVIDVTNKSARQLYIAILDLSTDGSIDKIYPTVAGESAALGPGLTVSRGFQAILPPGRASVKDTLKVFASSKPIDLTPLTQGAIREAVAREADNTDPLNDLLAESAGTPRGLRPEGSTGDGSSGTGDAPPPAKVADWNAMQKMLLIAK